MPSVLWKAGMRGHADLAASRSTGYEMLIGSLKLESRMGPKFFNNADNVAEIGSGFLLHQAPADMLIAADLC